MDIKIKEEVPDYCENNVIVDIFECENVKIEELSEDEIKNKEQKVSLTRLNITENNETQITLDLSEYALSRSHNDGISSECANQNQNALSNKSLKKFPCKVCKVQFDSKRGLLHHKASHRKKLSCSECEQVFQSKSEYRTHLDVHKNNKQETPPAQTCVKVEAPSNFYEVNNRVRRTSRKFWCKKCKATIFSEEWFNLHRAKHDQNMLRCWYCPEFFHSQPDLKEHTRTHANADLHTCEICGKSFLHKFSIESHLSVHFSDDSYFCEICNKTYKAKRYYNNHLKRVHKKQYRCSICGKPFRELSYMKKHILDHQLQSYSYSPEKKNACGICKKLFSTYSHVKRHMATHEKNNQIPYDLQCDNPVSSISFWCDLCNIKIFSEEWHKEHTLRHTKYGFYCPEGCLFFGSQAELDAHVVTHRSSIEFECDVCGRLLHEKLSLKNHMTLHFPDESHVCKICKKVLRNNYLLGRHMRQAHNKQYECPVCKKLFYCPPNLNRHMRSHQPKSGVFVDISDRVKNSVRKNKKIDLNDAPRGEGEFWCETCRINIESEQAFKEHNEAHKMNLYRCPLCEKITPHFSGFKNHYANHALIWSFKCDLCEKTFRRKDGLRRHIFNHLSEECFMCEFCNKPYKSISTFRGHIRFAHRLNYPMLRRNKKYLCHVCYVEYETPYKLHLHFLDRHKDKVWCHKTDVLPKKGEGLKPFVKGVPNNVPSGIVIKKEKDVM